MTNQTITKPIGLIKNLKIYSHGILHIVTFIVIQNNVLNVSSSMLLSSPWLRDPKVSHNWGTNLITIKGNGSVRTIIVTKRLDDCTKHLEVLFCYNFVNGVIGEGEDILLATKLDLFTIGMVSLPTSISKNSLPNYSIIELEDQF
jgi:hypothetical protein